jgi:glycoside hydrolase-like protein
MALAGTVQSAAPGLLGFDANTVIASNVARQFSAQGYSFCIRYVSRGPQPQGDLSATEANVILDAKLALMPVQHVRAPGWQPSTALGEKDGTFAAQNSSLVGFPLGINVWCDLEGTKNGTSADDVIGYCNAWYVAVKSAGYLPGLYVGANAILSDQQLANLKFQNYWRSQSNVPNVRSRGYQLIQLFPEVMRNGIGIDIDVTQDDYKNGQVQWLVRAGKTPPDTFSRTAKKST